jgi:hypothetical protein
VTASELALSKLLTDNNYRVLRNGWPDLLVIPPDGGSSFAVELKSSRDKVRPHRKEMHEALEAAGVRVLVAKEASSIDVSVEHVVTGVMDAQPEIAHEPETLKTTPDPAVTAWIKSEPGRPRSGCRDDPGGATRSRS